MKHNKIKIRTPDGFRLSAVHTVSESKAIVLWLHGISVDKDEYLNLFKDGARFLGENSIDSLRLDFRGHGDSSGKSTDFTISSQMIDVYAAIEYINQYYGKGLPKLHLVGCSFGAPPVIFHAQANPNLASSITLIAPVLDYTRTFIKPETEAFREIFNNDSISKLYTKGEMPYVPGFKIGIELYVEMKLINPMAAVANLQQARVTILHGKADSLVPFSISADACKKFARLKLKGYPDMDHGFNDKDDEDGVSAKSLSNKKSIFEEILNQVML